MQEHERLDHQSLIQSSLISNLEDEHVKEDYFQVFLSKKKSSDNIKRQSNDLRNLKIRSSQQRLSQRLSSASPIEISNRYSSLSPMDTSKRLNSASPVEISHRISSISPLEGSNPVSSIKDRSFSDKDVLKILSQENIQENSVENQSTQQNPAVSSNVVKVNESIEKKNKKLKR